MKKTILVAVALLGFGISFAQEEVKSVADVKFGVKGGMNLANIVGDDAGDANNYVGFNAGFFVEIPITNKLTFQPELIYSAQGSKSEGTVNVEGTLVNFDATLKLNYINSYDVQISSS